MYLPRAIKSIVEGAGFQICPTCEGEGEVGYFCGHETTTTCTMCAGHGVIRSEKKQKHRKTCRICDGRGGLGCCGHKGYHQWETYELFEPRGTEWPARRDSNPQPTA